MKKNDLYVPLFAFLFYFITKCFDFENYCSSEKKEGKLSNKTQNALVHEANDLDWCMVLFTKLLKLLQCLDLLSHRYRCACVRCDYEWATVYDASVLAIEWIQFHLCECSLYCLVTILCGWLAFFINFFFFLSRSEVRYQVLCNILLKSSAWTGIILIDLLNLYIQHNNLGNVHNWLWNLYLSSLKFLLLWISSSEFLCWNFFLIFFFNKIFYFLFLFSE